jgi:hypothetical protein
MYCVPCSYRINAKQITENRLVIYSNGTVLWLPATVYTVPCTMTITYFPWDSHTCNLMLCSWVLSDKELSLEIRNGSYNISFLNSEWEVTSHTLATVSTNFGQGDDFTCVTYTVEFRRRTGFFTYVVVLPSILMSFMTLVVFCLPPNIEEKLNIGTYIIIYTPSLNILSRIVKCNTG